MGNGETSIGRPVVKVGATERGEFEPDRATISVRFGREFKTQEECAEDYKKEVRRVKDVLVRFGLADEMKTSRYSTYNYRYGRRGNVLAYRYSSTGTLDLARDEYDIRDICLAVQGSGTSATVEVEFSLSDRQSAEDSLMASAVAHARQNAEVLAKAAGMEIGGMSEIRYQWEGAEPMFFEYGTLYCGSAPADDDDDEEPDFDPEPKRVECHVDTEWWVKPASE